MADDELVGVNGECQGPFRKRVPAIVTFEEAFFWQKQKDASLTIAQFQRDFKSYTEIEKGRFTMKSWQSLTDFMVRFHWHKVNRLKETYRFFRDDKNRREYDGTRKLINAAQWLSAFYEKNSEANQMIKSCLDRRKEEIDGYLQNTEESSDLKSFESLLGELRGTILTVVKVVVPVIVEVIRPHLLQLLVLVI